MISVKKTRNYEKGRQGGKKSKHNSLKGRAGNGSEKRNLTKQGKQSQGAPSDVRVTATRPVSQPETKHSKVEDTSCGSGKRHR